nr:hypothetical protein [Lachnospiraceae bacterium]
YKECPRDVVNNYYIYSVGNIMYTGSGHRNFKDYDDEVKLFINTIVAAYVPEKDPGRIEIENGVGQTIINNEKVIVVYAYFDADNESVPVAGTRSVDIEFFVDDSNLDSDENSIFYVKEGDTDITGQVELYDEAGNKILLSGSQYSVAKGYTYTLKVPIEFLCDPATGLNNDSRMITLFAQPAVDTISQKIKIIRRSIFDLN